jgi:hypothetical protein
VLVGGCCHEYEVALLRDDEQKILLREVERSKFSAVLASETAAGRNWLMDAVQNAEPPG